MMIYALIALVVVVLFIGIMCLVYGVFLLSPSWFNFIHHCRRFNLSIKQQKNVVKLLKQSNVENPMLLFTGALTADRVINQLKKTDKDNFDLLEKLYQIRGDIAKTHLAHILAETTLTSTKQIVRGQRLTIETDNDESVVATLTSDNEKYLILTLETEPKHLGRTINVYFWSDNIGYCFQTIVSKHEGTTLTLPHTDALLCKPRRTQRRADIEIPAEYFLLTENGENPYTVKSQDGFPCQLKDLSEGGLSFVAEGKGNVNLNLKVQFILNNQPIIMCGTVRASSYDVKENCSTLHIQADGKMPFEMLDVVLSYIYGIKFDETVPF